METSMSTAAAALMLFATGPLAALLLASGLSHLRDMFRGL